MATQFQAMIKCKSNFEMSEKASELQSFQKFRIMRQPQTQQALKLIFGHYVFIGKNLFSAQCIETNTLIDTQVLISNRLYSISISYVSEFSLSTLGTAQMEENPVAIQFINSVIKSCLRNSNLVQIGRTQRFFDKQQAQSFNNIVQTWPGFYTSTWIIQKGLYLIIDNISKFLSVSSCWDLLQERAKQFGYDKAAEELINAVVIVTYGNQQTYKIHQVRYDLNPEKYSFDRGETKISMSEYFLSEYKKKIFYLDQPLLEIKRKRGDSIMLPPELCLVVGLPPAVRNDKKLLVNIKRASQQRPDQRVKTAQQVNKILAESKQLQEWELEVDLRPEELQANILYRPSIFGIQTEQQIKDNIQPEIIKLDDISILKTIVAEPIHFQKWAIFCQDKDYSNAKYIQEKFYNLSEQNGLKIYVEFGEIISLKNFSKIDDFNDSITDYFYNSVETNHGNNKKYKSSKEQQQDKAKPLYFFLVIIPQPYFYNGIKNNINAKCPVISQFVLSKTFTRDQDGIFINILRQINTKLGGDLWRINFGKEISKRTMLVGIDVCHKGNSSTIGFVATYDTHMCKYYAQSSPQQFKGQELIQSQILQEYYAGAFQAYRDFNKGELPDHIFIYRDGVGDAMRQQIVDTELEMLKAIIIEEYNLKSTNIEHGFPPITLIIVNKRINQRFFEHHNGKITNPPQGTYIDKGFVQNSDVVDGKFDFFLIPHAVTQGAVKPTHFYVAENSSNISKDGILNFTYALCYSYYNWADSTKVPAPIMMADKVAYYRSEVGNTPKKESLQKHLYYL